MLLACILSAALCQGQVRIQVKVEGPLPAPDKDLYIATDFNSWNPGSPDYALTKEADGSYFIVLTDTPEKFLYKFTQGSWPLVEGTTEGKPRGNRIYSRRENPTGRIETRIDGWENGYTFTVRQIPDNTPHDASLYITGNFNNWNPGDPDFQLEKKSDGTYQIRLYTDLIKIEYKFTRGNWASVEARESGKARPNRVLYPFDEPGFNHRELEIAGWEDMMGTLHFFSLYDLLLLFSVGLGLLLSVAIPALQAYSREANQWLIASLSLSALLTLLYLLSNYQQFVNGSPKLVLLPDFILFLYAPIFYFYIQKLLNGAWKPSMPRYLHFVPFLIQFFVYLPFLLKSDKIFLLNVMNQETAILSLFIVSGFLGLLWNGYYWLQYRRILNTYQTGFRDSSHTEKISQYLNTVLVIQFVCLCFWTFTYVLLLLQWLFNIELSSLIESSVDIVWLGFSFIPYFVGYFAIRLPEIIRARPPAFERAAKVPVPLREATLNEAAPAPTLPDDMAILTQEIEKLEKHMAVNKPYVNPKLSLPELASQLDFTPHLLSRIINDHFGKNFFDFINTYRILEFKELIEKSRNHNHTFLSLAYEVGFNSKTAFNRSFKKITGQTPREYFDSISTQ